MKQPFIDLEAPTPADSVSPLTQQKIGIASILLVFIELIYILGASPHSGALSVRTHPATGCSAPIDARRSTFHQAACSVPLDFHIN